MTAPAHEHIGWYARLTVEKYDEETTAEAIERTGLAAPTGADFARLGLAPDNIIISERNLVTTAGLGRLAGLLIGSGQAATATAARIGVGDGAGTAALADVDLSAAAGSTHRWFQVMDASFPSVSGAVATLKSTFASGDGNFAWNEWCVDIGTPTVTSGATINAIMLNHKTSAGFGTKGSGTSWVGTATFTMGNAA